MSDPLENAGELYLACPHCYCMVEIPPRQLNCAIFRHAIYKDTLKQLDPHAPRDVCDRLVAHDLIYGCGKPFRVVMSGGGEWTAQVCDYI